MMFSLTFSKKIKAGDIQTDMLAPYKRANNTPVVIASAQNPTGPEATHDHWLY